MKMQAAMMALSVVFALGCAAEAPTIIGEVDSWADAPFAKGDGTDEADTSCRVVLRQIGHSKTNVYSGDLWVTFSGKFDVAESLIADGATPMLIYKAGSESKFNWANGTPSGRGPTGFKRFSFKLDAGTLMPHDVEFKRDTLQVIAVARTADGRILDHNSRGLESAGVELTPENKYRFSAPSSTCSAPMRAAEVNKDDPDKVTLVVKTGPANEDPCANGAPLLNEYTVRDYQTDAGNSVHLCAFVAKAGVTDGWGTSPETADVFDVKLQYRFARSGDFTPTSLTFHKVANKTAVYTVNLNELDPFPESGCPAEGVALEYKEEAFNMWARAEMYVTVGTKEYKPQAGGFFSALYGAFPAFECLH